MKAHLYRALLDISAAEALLPQPSPKLIDDPWEQMRAHIHAARMALEAEWAESQNSAKKEEDRG